jgi:uncharacterized protein YdaU (DUF1376 family)
MHYYQFSIGDYRAATMHLSNEEDLAYRRLLDMYYDTENKIPLDTQWVAKRLRLATEVVDDVLKDMFVKHEDGWFHARCDDVIQQYHAMAEKNRANGRLGGRKKNPVGNQLETQSEPIAKATKNYKPETNNQEPKKKATVVATPEGVSQSVWDEFIAHRKGKKAKVTDLVVEGIAKEATKAGWSMEDALKETIVRNWQSFKAEWVAVKPQMQNKWDVAGITTPPPPNQDAALRKIEEDRKRAVPPSLEVLAKMAELRKGAKV